MSNKATFKERLLYLFSEKRGQDAYSERMKREQMQEQKPEKAGKHTSTPRMAASGYGNRGASQTLSSMIGWIVNGGSAEDDIDVHGALLRKRARDLYAGGGLARSGPNTLSTNVVGWGIIPKPKIDGELLGLSDEQRDEWERNTLREFKLWAENPMCDAERQQNFYGLQQLTFLSMLMSGDVFVLFGMKENKRTPYQTTIRILEADRVATPDSNGDSTAQASETAGNRIIDGVEIDKEGAVVRYYIASHHPLMESSDDELTYTPIDAYGKDTGYPLILHVMTHERPEQRRGVPFVAANIETLKQFDRYMNAELAANVVSSMLSLFIETESDDGTLGMEDAVNEEDRVTNDDIHLELAPGAVYSLPPGKKVKEVNPVRNNSAFKDFVETEETMIGSSMDIPKEVLIKKYESNYTASRGALLDFWRTVRVHRTRFNNMFNQPVYEQWLSEAVATGRIEAPGFFDDPAIRQAWCGCMWMGVSMGHVDPLKEVNAAAQRILLNISTEEQEASEYNGNDWNENIRQRRKEIAALAEIMPAQPSNGGGGDDGGDENENNDGSKAEALERYKIVRDIIRACAKLEEQEEIERDGE